MQLEMTPQLEVPVERMERAVARHTVACVTKLSLRWNAPLGLGTQW